MTEEQLVGLLGSGPLRQAAGQMSGRDDVVVTVATVGGRLLWASAAGSRRLFGRDPDEFIGTDRFDYVHPDDVDVVAGRLDTAVRDGVTVRYRLRALAADGRWVPTVTVAWRADGPAGTVLVAVTTSRPASTGIPAVPFGSRLTPPAADDVPPPDGPSRRR